MPSPADRLDPVLARYERPLLGYAVVRCGDHGMAQDAVQETMLRFLRHGPAGDVESLAPWLFTTCRNVLTDLRRKSSRHPLMEFPADPSAASAVTETVSPESAPDEALAEKETARALRRLITALPEIQQEVVRLKFETGLAYRDIATATGLSTANVGWLLHQAVATLRQDWRRLENAGPLSPISC
ncbi:MAG: sigma-70 family RNA polymerase sigma factor [Verrucomicrobiota bacterium]